MKENNYLPLRVKYHDLSVLMKSKGKYVNLTDSSMTGDLIKLEMQGENAVLLLSISNYVLREWLVTEITIEELMLLAGVTGKNFVKQLTTYIDKDFSLELQAMFSAKKLLNYHYGVIRLKEDDKEAITYQFFKRCFKNQKSVQDNVLMKTFHRVPIS